MSVTNDFLAQTVLQQHFPSGYEYQAVRPYIVCNDGFKFSVQASRNHYCSPRENFLFAYETVEIGYPSQPESLIAEYAESPTHPTDTVYGRVPVDVVDAVIKKHGGIKKLLWNR